MRLLIALGVREVSPTLPTKDAGVDVRGLLVTEKLMRLRVAVQAKLYAVNVSRPDIQKLRVSMSHGEVGWFVTAGGSSEGEQVEAQAKDRQPIFLISGPEVADLLMTYHLAPDEAEQPPQLEKD